jgi:hypothetical protein
MEIATVQKRLVLASIELWSKPRVQVESAITGLIVAVIPNGRTISSSDNPRDYSLAVLTAQCKRNSMPRDK